MPTPTKFNAPNAAPPLAAVTSPAPNDCVYVVSLHRADPARPRALVGRLEHVMSGRRHDFDTGAALLGCLSQEQTHVLAARTAKR